MKSNDMIKRVDLHEKLVRIVLNNGKILSISLHDDFIDLNSLRLIGETYSISLIDEGKVK